MGDLRTPEELADEAYDRYVAEHGTVVTSPVFTELAAKTLHAAAKRSATAESSSLSSASAAPTPSGAAAGEGDPGAAESCPVVFEAVRGSAASKIARAPKGASTRRSKTGVVKA